MINYILVTYLVSFVGFTLYWLLIRRLSNSKVKKVMLMTVVLASFSLPFIIDKVNTSTGTYEQPCLHEHQIAEAVYMTFCPNNGEEVKMCYEIAAQVESLCSCGTEMTANNMLLFKGNLLYDVLIGIQPLAYYMSMIFLMIALVILSIRVGYLLYIIYRSKRQVYFVDGKKYTILRTHKPLSVCSFQLWQSYIIWQPEMDFLTKAEQDAILYHEIAHIEEKDTWVKIGMHLLQTLWLLNPVYYFIVRELDRINEFIADEFAVEKIGDVKGYASLLVKMKRYQNLPAMAQAFNQSSDLKERILHVLNHRPKKVRNIIVVLLCTIMVTFMSLTTYYAMPVVTHQLDTLKIHQTLAAANQDNGQEVFCKQCFLEKYGKLGY